MIRSPDRTRPDDSPNALWKWGAAIAASALSACALAQAGAIGLDILRSTFDGITSKNYGEAYREDADKLFHSITKPVSEGLAEAHADGIQESVQHASAPDSAPAPETAIAPAASTEAATGGAADPRVDATGNPSSSSTPEPVSALALEVGLFREEIVGGRSIPTPIQDGEILHDGYGSHGSGDNLKFMFRTNAAAYVYVISIDGTGWIQPLFPGAYAGSTNPVEPNRPYLFPEGSTWAPLDSYRGVEHLYFIASRTRRPDLEKSLAAFASRVRDVDPSRGGEGPTQLALVTSEAPVSRGFEAPRKSTVPDVPSSSGESFRVDTQLFNGTGPGDIVVTRWFRHQ